MEGRWREHLGNNFSRWRDRVLIVLFVLLGNTAVMHAARIGRNDIVKLLLKRGADMNAHAKDGATALRLAVRQGHTQTVRLLKQAGAKG